MKLNILALVGMYNHHISMARATLDALEAHGIAVDQGRGPSHIQLGDLFAEMEDAEVEGQLAALREAAGVDDPKPVPVAAVPKVEPKPKVVTTPKAKRKTRNLSPEARERIAAAQRKRWAAARNPEPEPEARPS